MRRLHYSTPFKRDYKRLKKRGADMDKLTDAIALLMNDKPLPERFKDHPLQGEYQGARDCHLAPDWVLIYALTENELRLIRMGTHADLFG